MSRFDITMNDIQLECGCLAYIRNEIPCRDTRRLCQVHLEERADSKAFDEHNVTIDVDKLEQKILFLRSQIKLYYESRDRLSQDYYPMHFSKEESKSILAEYYRKKILELNS